MNLKKLNKNSEDQWENLVNNPKAKFQHLLKFKEVIEKTYKNCEARYYLNNRAIFPFFLVKSKLLGNRLVSLPFLDNGGFLGDYTKEDIMDLLKLLKKEKIKHIEIRLNSSFENIKQDNKILTNLGFKKDDSKQQLIIKLKSQQEMWKNFHKHTRNDIRKAEKSGLTLKKIKDKELKKFYKLYIQNMKSFGTPQHSYTFFKNLFEMKENVLGFNCYYQNNLAGSIILVYNGENGYISYNVSEPKYRQYRPNDFIYWEIIKLAIKKGIKYLDLGQIDDSSERAIGLYKFKRKWLGDIYDRAYYYYDLEKKENKSEKKDKLKKFRSIWKKIPSPILKLIGPRIASQLGT